MTASGSPRLGPPPPRPRFARLREFLRGPRAWVAAAVGLAAVATAILVATRSDERWSEPPTLEPPVETLETRWLHEADAWLAWVEDARLEPQHRAVQRCRGEFDRTVGVPPSERLDQFAELRGAARIRGRLRPRGPNPPLARGVCVLALIDRPEAELGADAVRRLASGVRVLAHEAEHSAGRFNEVVAECYAMQKVRRAARLLGVRPAFAARLARVVWLEIYPLGLPRYHSDRCRDGGPLDLRPKSSVWP